ncbi:hypothetical protein AAFF16_003861 [Citrobacter werkmanii]
MFLINYVILLLVTIIITLIDNGGLLAFLCESAIALLILGYSANKRGIPYTENAALIFASLSYFFILMYHIMFDAIVPMPFLLKATLSERYEATLLSLFFVNALILGGLLSVFFSPPREMYREFQANRPLHLSRKIIGQLFFIAWFPVILSIIAYFAYFRTQPYVALHIDGGGGWGYGLKFIYVSCAIVFIVGILEDDFNKYKWKLILLTFALIFVYGVLYKLRSPLMYYLLLLLFVHGRRLRLRSLILIGVIGVISLAGIALIRDSSLTESGVGTGLLDMIVGLGGQVDSMIFAKHYIDSNGIMGGAGFLNSFFGLAEPMTNEYAKSIDLDYFNAGGGFGFFITSDFLLNFGVSFGLLAMLFFGYLLTSIRRIQSGFYSLAFLSTVYAGAFVLVRNDFGSTFRSSMYTFISILLVMLVLKIAVLSSANKVGQQSKE